MWLCLSRSWCPQLIPIQGPGWWPVRRAWGKGWQLATDVDSRVFLSSSLCLSPHYVIWAVWVSPGMSVFSVCHLGGVCVSSGMSMHSVSSGMSVFCMSSGMSVFSMCHQGCLCFLCVVWDVCVFSVSCRMSSGMSVFLYIVSFFMCYLRCVCYLPCVLSAFSVCYLGCLVFSMCYMGCLVLSGMSVFCVCYLGCLWSLWLPCLGGLCYLDALWDMCMMTAIYCQALKLILVCWIPENLLVTK